MSFNQWLKVCNLWKWQVHMCNKLASRHVRVGLASPSDVPRCDICENAPGKNFQFFYPYSSDSLCCYMCLIVFSMSFVAFFYCETDGSSLCLQCDMIVHVGGKRTHGRYLLFRQRVEVCLSFIQIELVLYLLDSYRFLRKTNVSILVVMFVFFSFTGI
jgi:hypothetical protein